MALLAASGVPGLVVGRRSSLGQNIASAVAIGGALLGFAAALLALARGGTEEATFVGTLPELPLHLRLDPLAAFFLIPIHVLGAAGTLYGAGYWRQAEHPATARKLRLWLGVLVASLSGVVIAGDGFAFLLAWEIMAVSAFLLVTTEDDRAEVQQAGWVYLVATHAGTLLLFALFGVLWASTGSLELRPMSSGIRPGGAAPVLFLLAFAAFGLKAGIVPMHFWLPAAHANAPSHVSALLSGVVLKMGIYGLLRILTVLPPPPAAVGLLLLAIGVGSALYGVLFALGQHDLKRLLAYHSVENIGIIVMGIGFAVIGIGASRPAWVALGLGACLLHVWNHALFKGLLFLASGSAIHGAGTRDLDRLGGLAKPMAHTAILFAVGAVAICGLPPLNGFVSELLLYVGLFRAAAEGGDRTWSAAALAAPLLAMAGGLAIACFTKAFGTTFLGPSRSEGAARAHESPPAMIAAMRVLALGCIGIGALPLLVMPAVDRVVRTWMSVDSPRPLLGELVPWTSVMGVCAALAAVVLVSAGVVRRRTRGAPASVVTWDCGYQRPSSTMAYTASSFAQILVALHGWLLRPRAANPISSELFPPASRFHSEVRERVLSDVLAPLWGRFRRTLAPLRILQQGRIQHYVMYVLLTLCVLILASFRLEEILVRLLRW